MTKISWDNATPSYTAGCDRGVLYLDNVGVPWNGLVSVEEVSGSIVSSEEYFEGVRCLLPQVSEDFKAQVAAYTYPVEFSEYLGYDDNYDSAVEKRYGFSYRTGDSKTGKIHLVYNVVTLPLSDYEISSRYSTVNPTLFNWVFETIPIAHAGIRPTAHFYVDLSLLDESIVANLEAALYGTSSTTAHLPTIPELITILDPSNTVSVVDNGDGTWTITASDDIVDFTGPDTFEIDWGLVTVIDPDNYTLPVL
jgi:hypothetical protein